MKDHDLRLLTRRLESLQHDTLQPETGQHMEYAGSVTQESNEQGKAITTCIYMDGGGCMVDRFCEKPIFPYCKGIYFI